jgi:tetratricopeptide (TPR) repeat protein
MEIGTLASVVLLCGALVLPALFADRTWRIGAIATLVLAVLLWWIAGGMGVFPREARAPLSANLIILGASYEPLWSTLIGSGPNSFSDTWNAYRPASFNDTPPLRAEAPAHAYSTALLMALEYGVLGFAAFLLVPGTLIWRFLGTRRSEPLAQLFFWASLALFAVSCAYPLSLPLAVLAFSLAGCAEAEIAPSSTRDSASLRIAAAVLAAVAIPLCTIAVLQMSASREFSRGVAAGDTADAASHFASAADRWGAQRYLVQTARTASLVALANAQKETVSGVRPDLAELKRRIDEADTRFSYAIAADPKNPEVWIARAAFYGRLYVAGFQGSTEPAMDSISQAQLLAQARADIRFNKAVLANLFGDTDQARQYAQEALGLRPDYPEAQTLLAQLGH